MKRLSHNSKSQQKEVRTGGYIEKQASDFAKYLIMGQTLNSGASVSHKTGVFGKSRMKVFFPKIGDILLNHSAAPTLSFILSHRSSCSSIIFGVMLCPLII